jgi:hypothetical protein
MSYCTYWDLMKETNFYLFIYLKLEVQIPPVLNLTLIGSDVYRGAVSSGHQLEDAHPGPANQPCG